MLKFKSEKEMFDWVADMKGYQALPAEASIRKEDSIDQSKVSENYVLDGGKDGGVKLSLKHVHTDSYKVVPGWLDGLMDGPEMMPIERDGGEGEWTS